MASAKNSPLVERRYLSDEQTQFAALRRLLEATGKKAAGTDDGTEDWRGAQDDPDDRSILRRS